MYPCATRPKCDLRLFLCRSPVNVYLSIEPGTKEYKIIRKVQPLSLRTCYFAGEIRQMNKTHGETNVMHDDST